MSARLPALLVLPAVLLLPLNTACRPMASPDSGPAGDAFVITGALTSNGCAPGLDLSDPLIFSASLRREGALGYWRIGTQPWVPGTLDRGGEFHFTLRTETELYPPRRGTDPELDPGSAGCVVTMVESIDGRVIEAPGLDAGADAGASDAAQSVEGGTAGDAGDADSTSTMYLEATNRIELVPAAGSDCRYALLSAGGAFPTLPCAAIYALDGERL